MDAFEGTAGPVKLFHWRELPIARLDGGAPQFGCVYVLVLEDEVLYVGQTSNLCERLRAHTRPGGKLGDLPCEHYSMVEARYQALSEISDRLRLETIYVATWVPPRNEALLLRVHGQKFSEIRFRSGTRRPSRNRRRKK